MSDNSEMVDDKETSLAAVTDDSCVVKYIEIVPLDRPADDYCKPEFIEPVVEVKPEDFEDVKQEPADDSGTEATHYVTVRFQFKLTVLITEAFKYIAYVAIT